MSKLDNIDMLLQKQQRRKKMRNSLKIASLAVILAAAVLYLQHPLVAARLILICPQGATTLENVAVTTKMGRLTIITEGHTILLPDSCAVEITK